MFHAHSEICTNMKHADCASCTCCMTGQDVL
uniref:Uncharacterized protein n=1 Tax=Ackermannviridae sp. TaxID=2831612 RepID=A0A8S5VPH0_9CAUD|nr:MAG TPA: hypothetical protein [Ackermannviridae sp.]